MVVNRCDPFTLGYRSYMQGRGIEENPFPANVPENSEFRSGWSTARYDELNPGRDVPFSDYDPY